MPNISVTASSHPKYKDITVISAKGFIDTTTAPDFEQTFQRVLSEKKFNLIVDLKDVNYISSAGWGIFIAELKRIRSQKGNLFLVSMSPEVTDAFELLEFHTILKSFPDVNEAVQKGFGKTAEAKAAEKPRKGRGKVQAPTAQVFSGPPAENAPEPTPVVLKIKRRGLFEKLIRPWEWFSL